MKGIYKKISVGVLAAALLVGAGGISQGGQAFAASKAKSNVKVERHEINKDNVRIYHKLADKADEEAKYGWFDSFERSSNRLRIEYLVRNDKVKSAVEIRGPIGYKMEKEKLNLEYEDGWDLVENIGKLNKGQKYVVRIKNLYFEIIV